MSLVISIAVQDLDTAVMKVTAILSCMLYAATAVVAAPATIERRTSYNGGTAANDVASKGLEDYETSFDRKLLIPSSTLYTSYVHLRPRIN